MPSVGMVGLFWDKIMCFGAMFKRDEGVFYRFFGDEEGEIAVG